MRMFITLIVIYKYSHIHNKIKYLNTFALLGHIIEDDNIKVLLK